MRLIGITMLASLALAACAHHGEDGTAPAAAGQPVNGETAYLEHCAGCHETGMLGAPREGNPTDWEGRSKLWQAVLMEHAKTGYFDMPAKGGKTYLSDEVVDAAAEYMLENTFPNRPQD